MKGHEEERSNSIYPLFAQMQFESLHSVLVNALFAWFSLNFSITTVNLKKKILYNEFDLFNAQ